ncbi:MAG: hypothetical protein ACRESK_10045 [Gammaproteobacteria bacterium]
MRLSSVRMLVAIWSLCLLAACNRSPDYYFPLSGGKYWRYVLTYHTLDGNFKGIYAVENLGRRKDNDNDIYVRRLVDGSSRYLLLDDTGIRTMANEKTSGIQTQRVDLDHYIFRFPLAVGQEWQDTTISRALVKTGPPQKTEFHINAVIPVLVRIDSLTDTVTVPAGIFPDCMRITRKGNTYANAGNYVGLTIVAIEETDWYAPGVGLVKSLRKESTTSKVLDKGEITLELEAYRR